MAGFVHQGFLQRYPYEGIDLSRHRIASDECVYYLDYKEQSALSDASGKCIRTIHVSELDGRVGTLEDWKTLIVRLCYVHSIVLFTTKRVFKLRTAARHALGQGGGSKGVSPLGNCVVTTKRVLINYAPRHVMPDANPSGAVAPPPLAGEAFLVGKRERGRFTSMHGRTSCPAPIPPALHQCGGNFCASH